jgi:hypothetical protein
MVAAIGKPGGFRGFIHAPSLRLRWIPAHVRVANIPHRRQTDAVIWTATDMEAFTARIDDLDFPQAGRAAFRRE